MGAGETRLKPGEIHHPERAGFYEKPDGADAGDAPRDSLGASAGAWVRKCEYWRTTQTWRAMRRFLWANSMRSSGR